MTIATFFHLSLMLLLSLNARGLRREEKVNAVIFQSHFDILCLQETKWGISQEKEMSHKWKGKMFSSTSSTQAGGVAIFMREGLFNNCHLIHKDQQGKFIIIDFFYNNISCRLINIHAPNIDTHRKRFFIGLRQWIVTNCIIIGDFNITLTKSDISNNCTFSEDYSRNTLFDITQNSLVDIWRFFHPGKKQFTRKQNWLSNIYILMDQPQEPK
uniref:exodeoxyribonuclease III n=1 Tax=Poecilia mexicana TaxID=48701 RepID=A0A3B3XMY7_9TELE